MLINGESTKYLVVGDKLYVSVGIRVGDNTLTLVSGTTENTYTISVVSSGIVENVIWADGPLMITWSDGGRVVLPASAFTDVPSGSKMRFYFTDNNGAWAQAQVNDGQWGSFFTFVPSDVAEYDWWNVTNTERYYDVELTADMLNQISANQAVEGDFAGAGIIIQGSDLIFSKVSIIIDYSAPTAIWEGLFDIGNWQGNQDLAWGGYDWSTAKAGQTLYFSFTMNDGNDWGCLSLRHGNSWGNLLQRVLVKLILARQIPRGTYTLTQADIDDLVANGGLVITGANLTLTQVAINNI